MRELQHEQRDEPMNKKHMTEMLKEYDFSKAVRGKYAKRYKEGTNIVVLSPDVAKVFHDSSSVNEALRVLIKINTHKAFAT